MKLLLLVLLPFAALAQTFQVDPPPLPITVACPSGGQATASGNTYTCPGGVTPPTCPSPPGAGPCPPAPVCAGYTSVNLGDIMFGDKTRDSQGVQGNIVAYGRIVIPNPLPAGWSGRTTAMSVFEHGDGTAWKQLWLSKDKPCVFQNSGFNLSQGLTASVYLTFNGSGAGTVAVKPGEVWYATIRNQLPNGAASCAPGSSCNFGYLLPYPGM